jgi:DNA-binding NarL/FixJ family response regulator
MNEIERAEARNLAARMRLADDPIFIIKQRRAPRETPNFIHTSKPRKTMPSSQELRVLEYLSRGLTNVMVADVMDISVNTVKEDLKRIREKLGAKNTTHACCEAIRLKYIK